MILSCVVRRGTDATYPVHADVGRKLPADLVAQAQTELHIGDAAADSTLRIILAVQVDLGFRLQDQPLGEQQLVLGPQARSRTACCADIAGGFKFKPVRRPSLHPEGRPDAVRPRPESLAPAQLPTP